MSIEKLKGKTLKEIYQSDDEIYFVDTNGGIARMWHDQSCCESVYIESIAGDLNDLIGYEIFVATGEERESKGRDKLHGNVTYQKDADWLDESVTWTFYKIATVKGFVDIRWVGSSNGYYSESVDFDHEYNSMPSAMGDFVAFRGHES